jgi:aminopeptidase N
MIVAVDDFNMGAMENKGLNVFNSKYVLADSASATDADYEGIEAVIAHEYFHNWTGNRVTCRDWFQLSLKEGLTVFRDQEFSADMGSRAVKRIEDVQMLRARQFAEDAGPMAHPIRPESYMEINNFYTLTVYEKGAEVIRMQHTLLGEEGFRKGTDLYFDRHDGQAVTCNDFIAAMADANDFDMAQFEQWYKQAGTPTVNVTDSYDETKQEYTLNFKQTSPDTPGQSNKPPLMIPIQTALITDSVEQEQLIVLTKATQSVVFVNVKTKPVPSLLRGFSAPVKLIYDYTDAQLSTIMSKDTDSFNRWEACQILASKIILGQEEGDNEEPTKDLFLDSLVAMMDSGMDLSLLAMSLVLPDEITLSGMQTPVDIDGLYMYREALRKQIAMKLEKQFASVYKQLNADLSAKAYKVDSVSIAKRRLKNVCLTYLVLLAEPEYIALAQAQYDTANNMTDSFSAMRVLVSNSKQAGEQGVDATLGNFEEKWKADPLVMDKWFALQVIQKQGDIVSVAEKLMEHNRFDFSNPNKVRSVIGAFAMSNPVQFHHASGRGYAFVAKQVAALDKTNPQIAARIVSAFNSWKLYDDARQSKMKQHLNDLLAIKGLSKGVYEIVSKALADG